MASIIRIKRSSVSGNPSTLAAGELAYSALVDNGSNGGDRLYIGMGTETAGNAANHVVIGGKFFTDMLDHTKGVLTANSAIITDSNSKIDVLKVDDLELNGNVISSTNTNGDIYITPNGTGKTVVTNLYIGDDQTPLLDVIQSASIGIAAGQGITTSYDSGTEITTISAKLASNSDAGIASFDSTDFSLTGTGENLVSLNVERVEDIVGAMVSGNTENGIVVTYDDTGGKLNFDVNDPVITIAGDVDGSATMTNLGNTTINVTLDTVNSNVGTFGSASTIPVVTVNAKGLVTAVSNATVATNLSIAGDSGTDTVSLLSDTLTFVGTDPIDTAITNNTVTISVKDATNSVKGVASFSSASFDVTSGVVTVKTGGIANNQLANNALTIGSTNIALGGTSTTLAGLTSVTSTSFVGALTGNASTATTLQTGRTIAISGPVTGTATSFNGGSNITIPVTSVDVSHANITGTLPVDHGGTGVTTSTGSGSVVLSASPTFTGAPIAPTAAVGTNTTQIATTAFVAAAVDAARSGLDAKESVRAATTGNITLSGIQTVDGVSLVAGDRVLVKNQGTGSQNGIYVVASGAWTRSSDADTNAKVTSGMFTFVSEGNTNADTGWVLSTNDPITVNTTALDFVQFSGAGQITAGNGLTKTGNTIDVVAGTGIAVNPDDVSLTGQALAFHNLSTSGIVARTGAGTVAGRTLTGTTNRVTVTNGDGVSGNPTFDIASTYVGQTSITTLGTVATGTWSATEIAATKGGTGQTTFAVGDILYSNATNALTKLTKPASATSLLQMTAAGVPSWVSLASTGITGLGTVTTGTWNATAIAATRGGTGITTYATGDMLYASAANTLAKLTAGTDGQVLQMNSSGVPVWGDIDGGTY